MNEYALLYKGILIRQKRHCQIASINADGELHRITYREHQGQQQSSRCRSNEMFDETDEDIEYFSSGGGGGERDVLQGCTLAVVVSAMSMLQKRRPTSK